METYTNNKAGTLYLLKSRTGIYKLGYTRRELSRRVSSANRLCNDDFMVMRTRVVQQPSKVEKSMLYDIWNNTDESDVGTEFFTIRSDGYTEGEIISLFEVGHEQRLD